MSATVTRYSRPSSTPARGIVRAPQNVLLREFEPHSTCIHGPNVKAVFSHQGVTLKFRRRIRAALSAAQREHVLYAMFLSMSRDDVELGAARTSDGQRATGAGVR